MSAELIPTVVNGSAMSQRGFTLIELIMVMILIGVLSAAAVSLFARTGAYSALAARDRFIAMGLLAQQQALANSGDATSLILRLEQQSSVWLLSLQSAGTDIVSDNIPRDGLSLSVNGSALINGQVISVSYQNNGSTGSNREWLFNGNSVQRACLTSTGFIHPGSCQP